MHVEAGRRRHLDADEVEALELYARDLTHGNVTPHVAACGEEREQVT